MNKIIENIYNTWNAKGDFSGVFSVSDDDGVIFHQTGGYRNRAEKLPNEPDTAFGIASGTKMFTGLAVCKLIDEGRLSLEDKLWDLLARDLGQIDRNVTVRHLLTHTSGVGDYIDEEADNITEQLDALYAKYPCYLWTHMDYYLQMTTPLPPKFRPGERFAYSNSGYVLIGLIIEAVSGMPYQQFVQENIIAPCKLAHTGFYPMDGLPANTALGYIEEGNSGQWRTNIFGLPIIGGSDGGIYTCAEDLDKLWRAVFSNRILSEEMTRTFLSRQAVIDEEDGISYGLGVYIADEGHRLAYYAIGMDSGVDFFTAYFPKTKIVASVLGNAYVSSGLFDALFNALGQNN